MRDALLARLRERLAQFTAQGDPRSILSPDTATDTKELLDYVPNDAHDVEVFRTAGTVHWLRYVYLPSEADEAELDRALELLESAHDVDFDAGVDDAVGLGVVIDLMRQAGADRRLVALRQALHMRFELKGDPDDLIEAIAVGRRAVAASQLNLTASAAAVSASSRLDASPRGSWRMSNRGLRFTSSSPVGWSWSSPVASARRATSSAASSAALSSAGSPAHGSL